MRSLVISLTMLCLLIAAGLPAAAQVRVVATTTDLAFFAKEIGGARASVTTICPGTTNPHFLETRPSHVKAVSEARLFIEMGLGLDNAWAVPLRRAAANPRLHVVTASKDARILEKPTGPVDPAQGHTHPQGNPHIALSPSNALRICANILGGYRAVDPNNDSYYTARARDLMNRIADASKRWQQQLAPHRGQRYVSYHATFEYLADALGLRKVATIEPKPGVPPSSGRVTEVINIVRSNRVRMLWQEPYYAAGAARSVSQATGARLLTLAPQSGAVTGTETWFKMMDYNVRQILSALQ